MRINLALANITNNPAKAVLSLAGIGVAIVLVFMQLGFRGAVENTAINVYQRLDFDILVRSTDYLHFTDNGSFEESILYELKSFEGVHSVNRMMVSIGGWRIDRGNQLGQEKAFMLLGFDLDEMLVSDEKIVAQLPRLVAVDSLLVDNKTHREFGPINGVRFSEADVGRLVRISGTPTTINGVFSMGAGLAANGAGIVSLDGFFHLLPVFPRNRVTFGLVKVADGEDPEILTSRLRARFREDFNQADFSRVEILSRQEVLDRELIRWLQETPIGFIFNLGVGVALIVGASIVYMVLSNDVADRLHEYATLQAMGYTLYDLSGVVLRQAVYLALFAFIPALAAAWGLYGVTSALANIELEMNWLRVLFVFLLTLLMNCFSGCLALRKLWQAAPADLF